MSSNRRQFLSACGTGVALAHRAMAADLRPTPQTSRWPSAFPALAQRVAGHLLTYLDSAATTLRPQAVIDALVEYYSGDNSNPSQVHALARRAAERLASARRTLARFVNAPDASEIIFVRGTTEGINLVAGSWGTANLAAGDEVLLGIGEHYSNLMPWTRVARETGALVRVFGVDEEGKPQLEELGKMLSRRTKVVAFSHVSNVLGLVNPIKEMCALARQSGARVLIDGAQGAPHVRIDVQDIGCDFYVFSGHKMLGPMGTGVVWGRRELLEAMPPYHVGSNMAHEVDFERATFEHGALKFQAGTPDVAGPVGLAAAVQWFETAGHDALWRHDQTLVQAGLAALTKIPGLRLIGSSRPERRVPVFSFALAGHRPAALARALDGRGIAIRAGDMAAGPLLKRFGVTEVARASAYVYSTVADIDRLAAALGDIAAGRTPGNADA